MAPRRHHYIPQMMQRNFADADLHLWSFDKRHPEHGVVRKPIRRLFRGQHLYTYRRRDGTHDTSTETRLSAIEGRAAPVLARVVADARAGRGAAFSRADHQVLVDLFVAQYRRSPDHHRAPLYRRAVADFLAGKWSRWESLYGPVTEEERAILSDERFMLDGARDIIARHAADPLETATATMLQRGFSVARIVVPRRAFILGSTSFTRFMAKGSRREDLDEQGAEIWMPVARDVALCSVGRADESSFVELGDAQIRKVNGAMARSSTVFASASRDLVEALARRIPRCIKLHGPWEAL